MPDKNPDTARFGGPGSSKQDRQHPERAAKPVEPQPGAPTNSRSSRVSGGGGERDRRHTHAPEDKS